MDALFTATSATCVTGLIVKDTGTDFTLMGQFVIMTLIQLGGLGIVVFGAVLSLLLGQALTLRESVAMQDLLNANTLNRLGNIIAFIFVFTLIAPQITDKIDLAPGHSLARVPAPLSFAGKSLLELGLREKYNVNLIMIKRSETAADHPGDMLAAKPGSIIYKDDLLLFVGTDVDLAKLPQE